MFAAKLSERSRLSMMLLLLSLLVYANTLRNGYVLDDVMVITENKYVQQGMSGIPALLTTHHLEGFGANPVSDYYRPLSLVTFAIENTLFGANPFIAHFINLLLFAGCVVLLYRFLCLLPGMEHSYAPFIAAVIFAVHPVHTEVVANIKSRDELMSFLFGFLALNTFYRYTKSGKWVQLFAGFVCLLLAILSKETVVTFVAIIPLLFFFFWKEDRKKALMVAVVTLLATGVFLWLWNMAQSRDAVQQPLSAKLLHNAAALPGGLQQIAAYWYILGYHVWLAILPYPMNSNYDFGAFAQYGFGSWRVWLSVLLYLFLIVFSIYRLFRKEKDPWSFAILFYLCTLVLFSNFLFPLGQSMANRYDFFPSVGYCFAGGLAFNKWFRHKAEGGFAITGNKLPTLALLVIALFYGGLTVARNADWKDNFTLVNADLGKSAGSYAMLYKAGLELQNKCETEPDSAKRLAMNRESIAYFRRSIELNHSYTESHADLGVAYLHEGAGDSAEVEFKMALRLNPAHFNTALNLGTLYFMREDFANAIVYYHWAIADFAATDCGWYNLGVCYARLNKPDSSIDAMKHALAINPAYDGYKAYGNIAILYEMLRNADSARHYEIMTQRYFPDFHLQGR